MVLSMGCSTISKPATSKSALVLTIPCDANGMREADFDADPQYPYRICRLHVLLSNTGKDPVKFWEECVSWGYYSLQLELIAPDGQQHLLKKKRRAFYENAPAFRILQPGEAMIWDVGLASDVWGDLSWVPENKILDVKIRAIYDVEPDVESAARGVWTGRLSSQLYDCRISRIGKREYK